ncbi:MAG TPA: cytochrome c biogenesis protein CcsA [Actinomycetota bacterium]|nr:cytochrome c biogenesis protein CcsA [Actinomycetota bacterium]
MRASALRTLVAITTIAMVAGLVAVFFVVPTDDFQGVVQRVFYIHVPSAWISYLAYTIVLIASIAYLKTGSRQWDALAHSSAEVGVVFTGLTLVTGMLWGKPIWGTYWAWDARLTLTFVLFLIYLGYLAFRWMATEPAGAGRVAAVIGITGFVTVPLVHFSVEWFKGQHPAPIVVDPQGGPHLPVAMLVTFLYMFGVFTLLFTAILAIRYRLARTQLLLDDLEVAS